ncbi:restriction endonuclease subunit S [Limosilactobacillus fermentum]
MPNKGEQVKLGAFFKSLDDNITLHQCKLDLLKEQKKGYLQKMFPKNGAKVPELRFAGFADAWEQRKLIDLLNQPITDGPHETPNLVEKGIPFISADAIVDNRIDFSRKRGFITEEYDLQCRKKYGPELYDVYLVKSGSTVGKVAIVETTKQFNIWSPLAAMRCKGKTNPYFLYFLFQTKENQNQVKSKASNGTQPNLSMRELEQFNVQISPLHDEQQKIGAFFKQLDSLITLHQRKLEKLQELKKGYLQKMFV